MTLPPPPPGYTAWKEHIISTAHGAHPPRDNPDKDPSQEVSDDERELARRWCIDSEIEQGLKWLDFLEEWWPQLSQRLGRTFEDVLYNRMCKDDYPDEGVHLQFQDGSEVIFRNAFSLGGPPPDYGRDDLHIFSKHCGYHRFVVDASDRISVIAAEPV